MLPAALATAALLVATGCGNEGTGTTKKTEKQPGKQSAADVDTSAGEGDWLLGITSAGGADGETSTTTYLIYNPATGETTTRRLPGVKAGSAGPEDASLLVSTDRRWAIADIEISAAAARSGKLEVHPFTGERPTVIDLRARTGRDDVRPIGWAFDPGTPDTLRVVDSRSRVWRVPVTGDKATQEGSLPRDPWFFNNGFNRNTGKPYVESMTSETTKPAGEGAADKSPVTRSGGTVLPGESAAFTALPKTPCRFGAGFTEADGLTWVFCADGPELKTYYLPEGTTEWTAYGEPSKPIAPEAAGFPVVLPPVE